MVSGGVAGDWNVGVEKMKFMTILWRFEDDLIKFRAYFF